MKRLVMIVLVLGMAFMLYHPTQPIGIGLCILAMIADLAAMIVLKLLLRLSSKPYNKIIGAFLLRWGVATMALCAIRQWPPSAWFVVSGFIVFVGLNLYWEKEMEKALKSSPYTWSGSFPIDD